MYNFNEILGNERIIENLKNSIKNNTVSHSYILDGKEKTGKETLAMAFSKLLLCENSLKEACGRCSSCISFDGKNNPDFIFIKSDKKKIGVNEIRDYILKNIEIKPFKYKYKVFIIKDAHNMTVQAQNAILKTIEDPPSFAIFIFLSKNYNSFLPTILSRCILFKIKPLTTNLIEKFLLNQDIDKEKATICAVYAHGSIGKAIEISKSQDFYNMREYIIKEIYEFDKKDLIETYTFINKLEIYKENINEVLNIFLLIYRDSIIFKLTNKYEKIIQKDINYIINDISNMSVRNLVKKMDAILKAKVYLNQNANFNMTMECLFLKLKEK